MMITPMKDSSRSEPESTASEVSSTGPTLPASRTCSDGSHPGVEGLNCCIDSTTGPALRSVTSSARGRTLSPYLLARCPLSWRGSRAVATTRWPASRAACANALPKPRELPVMSHVFDSVTCMPQLSRMGRATLLLKDRLSLVRSFTPGQASCQSVREARLPSAQLCRATPFANLA